MSGRDGLDRLFAPWRMTYVSRDDVKAGCIFCAAAEGGETTLTLAHGERCFALLNRFPYTTGHCMVAPRAHTGDLTSLVADDLAAMMTMAQRIMAALTEVYRPHGFNLGMNQGEAAGAGIVDHVHLHVVPRWRGDTNYMSTTGGVRVLPEDLDDTWSRLRVALEVRRD